MLSKQLWSLNAFKTALVSECLQNSSGQWMPSKQLWSVNAFKTALVSECLQNRSGQWMLSKQLWPVNAFKTALVSEYFQNSSGQWMPSKQLWSVNAFKTALLIKTRCVLSFYPFLTVKLYFWYQSVLPAAYVNSLFNCEYTYYGVMQSLKVILYSYLISKKMNERIIDI